MLNDLRRRNDDFRFFSLYWLKIFAKNLVLVRRETKKAAKEFAHERGKLRKFSRRIFPNVNNYEIFAAAYLLPILIAILREKLRMMSKYKSHARDDNFRVRCENEV